MTCTVIIGLEIKQMLKIFSGKLKKTMCFCTAQHISTMFILLLGVFVSGYAVADPVTKKIEKIEKKLGATIGVSVYERDTKNTWSYKGNEHFPLMSTFKTFACAALLSDVDAGKVKLGKPVEIKQDMLVTYSPVTEKYVGKEFTLRDACVAAMTMSDNTAANIVLDNIGGPKGLTRFMLRIGDNHTRLDRMEPTLNEAVPGDMRDTTTPDAITLSLNKILFEDVLTEHSKKQLKQWMMDNKVSDGLVRSVLPEGWKIADRSGAGGFGSRGITAVIWSETRPPVILSIYLSQTDASFDSRNQAIAEIGKEIISSLF